MIRTLLQVMLLAALALIEPVAASQDKKEAPPKEKPAPSLKVGDAAPALKASQWLQGEEVKAFEAGNVYVVEFWSTSCVPCIAFMPHLAELQRQYKGKKVTVIGLSADAFGDTEKKAAAFVKQRGPGLGYRFAYATDRTFEAWMKAAGREGIPCTFVVDKAGKIAFVGTPLYLPAVLPKVVAGTSTAKEIGKEMVEIQEEYNAVSEAFGDPKACLEALAKFEARHPTLADFVPAVKLKLTLLPKHGKEGEAKKYAEALVTSATRREDGLILSLASSLLRRGDGKESKDLLALAVKAAEARVKIDDGKDAGSLLDLADAYFVSGDKAKAKDYAGKALDAAKGGSAAFQQYAEKEARRLGAEK